MDGGLFIRPIHGHVYRMVVLVTEAKLMTSDLQAKLRELRQRLEGLRLPKESSDSEGAAQYDYAYNHGIADAIEQFGEWEAAYALVEEPFPRSRSPFGMSIHGRADAAGETASISRYARHAIVPPATTTLVLRMKAVFMNSNSQRPKPGYLKQLNAALQRDPQIPPMSTKQELFALRGMLEHCRRACSRGHRYSVPNSLGGFDVFATADVEAQLAKVTDALRALRSPGAP